jgi:signal peptidase II
MRMKYLLLAAISGAIITADQVMKMYIQTHFQVSESHAVLQNFFNFTYVRNPGAAFGFLADSAPVFREAFFLAMPPIALIVIIAILRGVAESDRWTIVSLSAVFAGAIGNYIDRLRFRYVIDFLDFTYKYTDSAGHEQMLTWPAFNIADMGIVCGVAGLLYIEFLKYNAARAVRTA